MLCTRSIIIAYTVGVWGLSNADSRTRKDVRPGICRAIIINITYILERNTCEITQTDILVFVLSTDYNRRSSRARDEYRFKR